MAAASRTRSASGCAPKGTASTPTFAPGAATRTSRTRPSQCSSAHHGARTLPHRYVEDSSIPVLQCSPRRAPFPTGTSRIRPSQCSSAHHGARTLPHRYVEDSSIPVLQCSAGLVNTFVLLQQFEWALERRAFEDDLWVGARGAIAMPCMQVLTTARGPFPTGGCARSDRAAHRGGA